MKVHGKKTGAGGALREPTPERGLEERIKEAMLHA